MDRRRAIAVIAAAGAGAVAAACSRRTATSPSAGSGPTGPSDGAAPSAGARSPDCVLTPELTEGPYYIDIDSVRSDITEGKAGVPLTLAVTVVDATSCQPVAGAAVDIWHCDAAGEYSGFGSASGAAEAPRGGGGGPGGGGQSPTNTRRFLRGTQITGASGVATFRTIYPGWYTGRTVHIHVKVHAGGRAVHTGQLFFDDGVTDTVYRKDPYAMRGSRDTRNAADGIFGQAGGSGVLDVKANGDAYETGITMGVKTS